jgi:cytochrome c oxidase cbb3-type subunit 2
LGFVATLVVPSVPSDQEPISSEGFDAIARPSGAAATLAMLFALVWLDSAAFTIIQNTPRLKLLSWGDPISQLRNGALHLVAAVIAGWLIDRRRLHAALLCAYAFISAGIFFLAGNDSRASMGTLFYVVAVSIYSTAIAAYAALASDGPGRLPIRWRAAILVAVCGVGSTLGIAMAQANNSVPFPFVVAGAIVMFIAFARLAFFRT